MLKLAINNKKESVLTTEITKVSKIYSCNNLAMTEEVSSGIPLYLSSVRAGFPSPADDYIEENLDLSQYLVKRPASTFIVRVSGDSMIKAGIFPGSLLVVDRSITPTDGKIVIAALVGELTVKRLSLKNGEVRLIAENDEYSPISVEGDLDMVIWGVVTSVIQELC